MNRLSRMLENFDDGQKIVVKLKNNDEFVLYDFEMVDESICQRTDLVLATVAEVLNSKFQYKDESKIELSIDDVFSLKDLIDGSTFYKVESCD